MKKGQGTLQRDAGDSAHARRNRQPALAVSFLAMLCLFATSLVAGAQDAIDQSDEASAEPIIITTHKATGSEKPTEPCFPVSTIRIEGSHRLLDRRRLIDAAMPHAISCQGNKSVSELVQAINALFADTGYVTTQAWIPEQDMAASGELSLKVVPGKIGRIAYHEKREPYQWFAPRMAARTGSVFRTTGPGDFVNRLGTWWKALDDDLERFTLLPPSARMATARTVAKGEILRLDPMQDTIDGFNRVPSQKAEAELQPGEEAATSDIVITNRIEDAFRLYAGYDTESVEGVDRLRFGITLEKDNLIGVNDTWALTLRSGEDVNELTGNVAVPFRNLTFHAAGDWSESATMLAPLTELFTTTWNTSVGFDWRLRSSKTSSTTSDISLHHRDHNRYLNGLGLERQKVSYLRAGLAHTQFFGQGSLSGRFGFAGGVPILGANRDPDDIDDVTPRRQFFKFEGSLSGSYVFPGKASLSSHISGQWTPHTLLSDDQLTIGSRASVRGFSNASFKADSGLVWRNEAAFQLPADLIVRGKKPAAGAMRGILSRFNPYVFVDGGVGRDNANDLTAYRISSGAGIRYGGPLLSFDTGYAFRLAADETTTTSQDEGGEVFVLLRLKLF